MMSVSGQVSALKNDKTQKTSEKIIGIIFMLKKNTDYLKYEYADGQDILRLKKGLVK